MDPRIWIPLLAAGSAVLLLAPTLAPPPSADLSSALDAQGPVRVEGVVATVRTDGDGTRVLLRNDTAVWVLVRGGPPLSPGDRVRLTARPDGGMLFAVGDDVEVVEAGRAVLLRHVARAPWDHEGNVTVEATVDDLFRTVLYLKDGGHRLRTVPGHAPFPPDGARPGDRVWATGRLAYAPDRMAYVLHLDGWAAAER